MRRTGSVFKLMAGGVEVVLLTAVAAYAEPGLAQSFFNRFKRGGSQTQVADTTALAPPTVSGAPDVTGSGGARENAAASSNAAPNGLVLQPAPQITPAVVYRYPGAPVYAPARVYRPVAPLAPTARSVTVGCGVVGQPTVYVPGQPVRNFLRWLSP